jgi:hypothetical protein
MASSIAGSPTRILRALRFTLLCLLGGSFACGEDDPPHEGPCTPGTTHGCTTGQVCEEVVSGEPACFAPVVLRGRVFDTQTDDGIAGATVVALDVNGSARSSVVLSQRDGRYELALPARRNESGAPVEDAITLRVAASGYQEFPALPREALPIDLTVTDLAAPVIMNAATDVGLISLPDTASGWAVIAGEIEHELAPGALVVAVQNDTAVSTAIADIEGAFTLFNVPPVETRVEAYRAGLAVTPETVRPAAGSRVANVTLSASTEGLARVSGSVNIVNAPGGLTTSVILVLESTLMESPGIVRGVAPAGLRAAGVSGSFAIEGVPPGDYAVLAAFENDQLVRDPDESIAGTRVVHIQVTADSGDLTVSESFKVTEALAIHSPGASALDLLAPGAAPVFTWADDSSEDGYELRVFDAFGELVYEALDLPRVNGSATVTHTWREAELEPGMIYQFRVMSFREGRGATGGRAYISATEDLRGVFQIEAEEP